MQTANAPFTWPHFLVTFIAAPLIFTLLTFWALVPIYALIIGGPLYLVAGLPLTAWYLRKYPPHVLPVLLLAQACQLLQIPILMVIAYQDYGRIDWDMLSGMLSMGAVFALLWGGTFIGLYRLFAKVKPPAKEIPNAPS